MNKIIEFFKRIFGKKQELIEAPKEEIKVNETITNDTFINDMKAQYNNEEESNNMKLFKAFRNGQIKEADLTEEQKEILNKIYDEKIAEEKMKIAKLNKKLALM